MSGQMTFEKRLVQGIAMHGTNNRQIRTAEIY